MTTQDITPEDSVVPVFLDPTPQEPVEDLPSLIPTVDDLRRDAYRDESDPLFFKWQRGEGTEQEWLDKVQEIRERHRGEHNG